MRRSSSLVRLPCLLLGAWLATPVAWAQSQAPIFDQVTTVATATAAVPLEENFTSGAAGVYQIQLTDLGATLTPTPAPLASVELAVTQGDTVVGTPLSAAGTLSVTLAANTAYTVRIVGIPGMPGSGPIALTVTDPSGNVLLAPQGLALAPSPSAPPATEAVVDGTFTVPSTDNYQITLTDFAQPAALTTVTLVLIEQGTGNVDATLPGGGNAYTATVTLQSGVTYRLFAVGQGAAGLFGARVAPAAGGAPVFSQAVPVGSVRSVGSVPGADTATTLTLHDLAFPAALTKLGAVVIRAGVPVASLAAAGSTQIAATVPATAGSDYVVYAYGTPASGSAGSFTVDVAPATGAAYLHVAQAVTDPAATIKGFAFSPNVTAGGSYTIDFTDLGLPSALSAPSLGAFQNATALTGSPLQAGGSLTSTLSAGALDLIVTATPAAAGGIFGLDVAPAGGGTPLLQTSQGVGGAFTVLPLSITTAGSYDVTVTDVGFPSVFGSLLVAVTQGTTTGGYIVGAGKFTFKATPGNYLISFIASPNATTQAGTFSVAVAPTPPAPTVTLTASALEVTSGGTATLTWSSTNATACTASGGWTGPLATSGSEATPIITSATTFTLTCTGDGGTSSPASVSVALTPAKGGGAIDGLLLLVLGACLAAAVLRKTARDSAR